MLKARDRNMLPIYIYNIFNIILFPIYILILFVRLLRGKERLFSVKNRLGFISHPRPRGGLIWVHAASVGESLVATTLVKNLSIKYKNYNFLITTGTISAYHILKKAFPEKINIQFVPLDNIISVGRFVNHWKPELGIFVESELWPCLITMCALRFNIILVNARLSDKSFKRWGHAKWLFKLLTNKFNKVLVQSEVDLQKYRSLGCAHAKNFDNIKFSNKKLEIDNKELEIFRNKVKGRKVFVAASTHKEDEEVLLQIIVKVKKMALKYLPIIILRHPNRKDEVIEECNKLGLNCSIRSRVIYPSLDEDVFIVDTFGELGLFYSLSDIAFVGGSFKQGGHNLLEPAYFKNIILLGPDMTNFKNITEEMVKAQSAIQVKDAKELEVKIVHFLSSKGEETENYQKNALKFVKGKEAIIDNYVNEIDQLLL